MANQYRSVLAGAGGTGGDALPAEVLSGKTFTNDNGPQTGTMVNRGAVSQNIAIGGSYTIPEGYHNGSGTVTASASGLTLVADQASNSAVTPVELTSGVYIWDCGYLGSTSTGQSYAPVKTGSGTMTEETVYTVDISASPTHQHGVVEVLFVTGTVQVERPNVNWYLKLNKIS